MEVSQHVEKSADKWSSHLVNGEHFYNRYAIRFLRYCLAIQPESWKWNSQWQMVNCKILQDIYVSLNDYSGHNSQPVNSQLVLDLLPYNM